MSKTASSKERIPQKYFVAKKPKLSEKARRKAQESIHNSPRESFAMVDSDSEFIYASEFKSCGLLWCILKEKSFYSAA